MFLSSHYLLCVKYNWQDFEIRKIELWSYLISLLLGLTTAIIAVGKNIINPADWDCWINKPQKCVDGLQDTECEGFSNLQYQLILFYGFV